MRPLLIVALDPEVEIVLQILDRSMEEFVAERYTIELVQRRLLEAFADSLVCGFFVLVLE
jgi:hypothetical protein